LPNTDSLRNYALDGLGNWRNTAYTPVGSAPGLDVRTHNKLNQITAFDAPSAPTPILYDQGNNAGSPPQKGNGNIIDDGTRLNAFDALNRLITVTRKIGTVLVATYAYDALGRRVIRIVSNGGVNNVTPFPNGTSRYLLDGQQIVEEIGGFVGFARVQYVWGHYIDELVQLNALVSVGPQGVTGANYLLSDLLYRSAALTGSTGTIVEAFDTDAYGNTIPFSAPGTDGLWFTDDDVQAAYSACRYVFTGREWDAEAKLHFYRSRFYNAPLGRFLSRDALVSTNLYEFIASSPASGVDPTGMDVSITERQDDTVGIALGAPAGTGVSGGIVFVQLKGCAGCDGAKPVCCQPAAVIDHLDIYTVYVSVSFILQKSKQHLTLQTANAKEIAAATKFQTVAIGFERGFWQTGISKAWNDDVKLFRLNVMTLGCQECNDTQKAVKVEFNSLGKSLSDDWQDLESQDARARLKNNPTKPNNPNVPRLRPTWGADQWAKIQTLSELAVPDPLVGRA
ncbi:MAG TPA: RHS repeat-associated core domain-containing protein, partial [Candidatus Methylacidiphilales bacterium]|nr:RHS repeat-associated core domain-containing protein [Candidatus Methylacidiphilales bacterium]